MPATAAQIEANRENAQLSTGPSSEAGKEVSSQNACRHNLTGGPALAAGEDEQAYEQFLQKYVEEYIPQSVPEGEQLKQLADASWRLDRVSRMEREVLAKCPNPFLEPDDPMAKQLMRLNRYRNSIQRTYDRAARELQILVEAETRRRTEKLAEQKAEVTPEVAEEGAAQSPQMEPARMVLAHRNGDTKRTQSANRTAAPWVTHAA